MEQELKKEDDLILGGELPTGEEVEYYEEYPDLHSEVASAYFALSAIAEIDTAILSKEKEKQIRAIRRKCIEILHRNIMDIHEEVFGRLEEGGKDEEEED
jgi:hypothetical protein